MKLRAGAKKPVTRQRRGSVTSAPSAYAYSSKRAIRTEDTDRQQSSVVTKRSKTLTLRYWARRSGLITIVLVTLICVVSVLSLSTKPRIILLDEGNTFAFQDTAKYQEAASKQLGSSLFNRNKVTVDTAAASRKLMGQFPELGTVTITLPLIGNRPIYYLQANAPSFVLQTGNGTFILDSSGKVLIAKDAAADTVAQGLPVITDQSGATATVGKQIISTDNTTFIQTVVATFKAKGVDIASLTLPAGKAQQLDVRLPGNNYYIKFDMHESGGVREQVGGYLALKAMLDAQGKTPSQYVDARIPGRVYYL